MLKIVDVLKNKTLTLAAGIVFILFACDTSNVQYNIPEPFVDETIYVSDPSSFNLTVVGGQLLIPNAGHSGILVYRRYFDGQFYDFAAYEAACPAHWVDGCGTLESSSGDFYFTCGCDRHQYQLFDGQSLDTNFRLPVKEYRCIYDGVNTINITN